MLTQIQYALRSLGRGAGPLIVSLFSLALGIAATATTLSVVDAIDFRPLPFRQADELVDLSTMHPSRPAFAARVAPGVYTDWRERIRSLESLAAASPIVVTLHDGAAALNAARVSDNFFSTLGVRPVIGRVFGADEVRGSARVAVLSHEAWDSHFGGAPDIAGRTVSLGWAGEFRSVDPQIHTIVGVLPRGVRYPSGAQVWIPAGGGFGESRSDRFLTVAGRLGDDVSLSGAQAEFKVISAQLATDFPEDYGQRLAKVRSLRDALRAAAGERGADTRFALLGIAAFVLLLAILNVAGVFLARTVARLRDLRVRLALGATRLRIATLLLTQSLILSLVAGSFGLLISHWFVRLASARLGIAEAGFELVLDGRFVVFALALSLLAGLFVALLPVWRLARLEQRTVLGSTSVRGSGVAETGRVQKGMVVGQVALAVVLLSGAGLLSNEYLRLATTETGFDPNHVLVASLPIGSAATPEESIAQSRRVERRIASLGEVSSAALGGLPAAGYSYRLEGRELSDEARDPMSYRVSPRYFETLRIPVVAGREFTSADREGSVPVGIVNRVAADQWWPGQSPIGQRVHMAGRDGAGEWVRIVGLTENERVMRSMTSDMPAILYRPFDQLTHERRRRRMFIRTAIAPEAAIGSVDRVLGSALGADGWRRDHLVTLESMLGDTLTEQRFRAWALSLFSALALILAVLGIYGVVATLVAQRTREIGLRIALGARPVQVLALVLRQGIVLAVIGFVLGLTGSVGMDRILQSMLVTATDFDVRMPLAAGAILGCAVLIACYFPARRAAQVDPKPLLHDS